MRKALVITLSLIAIAGCGSDGGPARTGGQAGGPNPTGTGGQATGTGGAQAGQGGDVGRDAALGGGGAIGSGGSTALGGSKADAPVSTGGVIGSDGAAGAGGGPGLDGSATGGVGGSAGTGGVDAPLGMGGVGGCICPDATPGTPGVSATGRMVSARTKHVATLLGTGEVLITGGASDGPYSTTPLASAERFDPEGGVFKAAGNMATARMGHTATLLPSGKVLVAGAKDSASAELFDSNTATFTATGDMNVARGEHTATLLDNGKVLIAGGFAGTTGLASAELFDPATGTFTPTGNMTQARYQHGAALLGNGKVLLVGGYVKPTDTNNNDGLASAELYDPATGTFTATGNMSIPRALPTATTLQSGAILVSGGPDGFEGYMPGDWLELYDLGVGKFLPITNLVEARALHTATRLPTGEVLFVGGYQGGGGFGKYLTSTELYSPASSSSTAGPSLIEARERHTATALADGRVLIAGGDANGKSLSSAELYR